MYSTEDRRVLKHEKRFFYKYKLKTIFQHVQLPVKRAAQRRINMNMLVHSCGGAVDYKFIILSFKEPRSAA